MKRTLWFALAGLALTAPAVLAGTMPGKAPAGSVSFAPDNFLWMEDDINNVRSITEAQFNAVVDAGVAAYKPLATDNKETLTVNKRWTDSTVNANCQRSGGKVTINMYGGLARREEVTLEGFAMVLCHELGHAYGGTPYLQVTSKMSAEGQADFYSANTCVRKLLPLMPTPTQVEFSSEAYITAKCAAVFPDDVTKQTMCMRTLRGGDGLGKLLAVLQGEAIPDFATPDKTVVTTTNLSYPATVQCRLDSYHNGAIDSNRPLCWFKP